MTLPKPEIVEIDESTRRSMGAQIYHVLKNIDRGVLPTEPIINKVYFFPQAEAQEAVALVDDLNVKISGIASDRCIATVSFSNGEHAPGQVVVVRSIYGNQFEDVRRIFHPEPPSLRGEKNL